MRVMRVYTTPVQFSVTSLEVDANIKDNFKG